MTSIHILALRNTDRRQWQPRWEANRDARKLYDRMADRSGFIQYRMLFAPV